MTTDPKSIALKQLANLVIDAYMNRDKRFVPVFRKGVERIVYLWRDDHDHPELRTNITYARSDYEAPVPSSEQEDADPATN